MHPASQIVHTITADRIREAEAARRTREGIVEQPTTKPRRPRKIRALARLALSSLR
jgi:hypothetical protein